MLDVMDVACTVHMQMSLAFYFWQNMFSVWGATHSYISVKEVKNTKNSNIVLNEWEIWINNKKILSNISF